MLANRNQPIVAGLLGASIVGIVAATALPFNDRIEYKIGNRIESQPAWLVPPKAEFRSVERGYGGIKILLAMLATGGMVTVMLIARKEAEQEPIRQRIKEYKNKAFEFDFAAESAYSMAQTQQRYKKLLEADEVALEGEIESAYMQSLGIDPNAQQPLLTGTATLESISNPGDKVQQQATPGAIEPEQDGPRMPNLSAYPAVLIYGVPGSGKTTFAEEELTKRIALGHEVIVLDPHAAYGAWQGCEVIGGGMNYQAINDKLDWLFKEVKDRYSRIEKEPNPQFRPLTITAEEFTKWSAKVKNSGELFWTALTDIRKIKIYIVFVSHTRTLIALGDAKGAAPLRDEGLLEVELKGESSQDNEGTGEAKPKFEALVKLPGHSLSERTLVKIAKHPTPPQATENPQKTKLSDSEYLQRVYDLEFNLDSKKPSASQMGDSAMSDDEIESDTPEPLSGKVSRFIWTVRAFGQMYPNVAPEQLFVAVSDAALSGANIRTIIRSVLKCAEKNEHPTRSYTRHGKSLLKWLIENYDNGEISQLPRIQEFLQSEKE